jgi:hypothetical protein
MTLSIEPTHKLKIDQKKLQNCKLKFLFWLMFFEKLAKLASCCTSG